MDFAVATSAFAVPTAVFAVPTADFAVPIAVPTAFVAVPTLFNPHIAIQIFGCLGGNGGVLSFWGDEGNRNFGVLF